MRQNIDSQAFLETPASVRTIYLCRDSGYVGGHPQSDAHTGLQKPVLLAPRIIKLTEMLTSYSPKHSDPLALEITNLTLTQRLMMALFGVLEVAGRVYGWALRDRRIASPEGEYISITANGGCPCRSLYVEVVKINYSVLSPSPRKTVAVRGLLI